MKANTQRKIHKLIIISTLCIAATSCKKYVLLDTQEAPGVLETIYALDELSTNAPTEQLRNAAKEVRNSTKKVIIDLNNKNYDTYESAERIAKRHYHLNDQNNIALNYKSINLAEENRDERYIGADLLAINEIQQLNETRKAKPGTKIIVQINNEAEYKQSFKQLISASKELPAEYQQPTFQCIGDNDICLRTKRELICGIAFVVCLAERLIPFKGK